MSISAMFIVHRCRCQAGEMVVDEVRTLYGVPPGDFVAERTQLVRQLKRDKRPDDAAALARLRRPKIAEWVLNRLAREDGAVVDRWVKLVAAARDAQSAAIGGASGGLLKAATNEMNVAMQAVADAAITLDQDVRRDDVIAVLRSLISADAAHLLTNGVVGSEGVLEPADLFAGAQEPPVRLLRVHAPTAKSSSRSLAVGLTSRADRVIDASVADREPELSREPRPSADEIRRRTTLIADQVRARTALQEAEASVDAAQSDVDDARTRVDQAGAELDRARAALDEASAAFDKGRAGLDAAETTLLKRRHGYSEAQQHADRLDSEFRQFDNT